MKLILNTIVLTIILGLFHTSTATAQEYLPSAMAKHNEGIEYYNQGNYKSAINSFKKAVEIDPSFIDSYYNLGILYEFTGNTTEAIMAFKNLLAKNPDDSEAAYKIAKIYFDKGNYKTSLNYIHIVEEGSPHYKKTQELYKKVISAINESNQRQKEEILKARSSQSNQLLLLNPIKRIHKNIPGPTGITKDNQGNIYVASFSSNSIVQINQKGEQNIILKGTPLNGPIGLVMDSFYNLYTACYKSGKIIRVSPDGSTKIILEGLKKPYYLFIDSTNTLYVSEQGSNSVMKVKIYK